MHIYKIVRKLRPSGSSMVANLSQDFLLEKEKSTSTADILKDKSVSLYCIDHERKNAVFVKTNGHFKMEDTTFVYERQYYEAEKVITVPYADLIRMTQQIDCPMQNVCLLFSVGRCGSTLIHKMLSTVSSVISISEPDVYTQVHYLRKHGKMDENEACDILSSATKVYWNSVNATAENVLFIKLRSEVTESWADLIRAIPTKRLIFMYRNAVDVIQSFNKILGYSYGVERYVRQVPIISSLYYLLRKLLYLGHSYGVERYVRQVPIIRGIYYLLKKSLLLNRNLQLKTYAKLFKGIILVDLFAHLHPLVDYPLLEWLVKMDAYKRMCRANLPISAIRYEDLISNPETFFKILLKYCGFPADGIKIACEQLFSDSQQDSQLARNKLKDFRLDDRDRKDIENTIERYTEFSGSHHILPGTLCTGCMIPDQ